MAPPRRARISTGWAGGGAGWAGGPGAAGPGMAAGKAWYGTVNSLWYELLQPAGAGTGRPARAASTASRPLLLNSRYRRRCRRSVMTTAAYPRTSSTAITGAPGTPATTSVTTAT